MLCSGSTVLCPGMGLFVYFLQFINREMGIDLGSGQTAVSEQFLDGAQIGSVIQEMSGERMPQDMGTEFLGQ